MPAPNILVFDAYGTLFDVYSVAAKCEALFPGKGEALAQRWRMKQLEYTWLTTLMQRYVTFEEVTRASLQFACAALKCEYSDSALASLMAVYRELPAFAETREVLADLLARGARLAILSNGTQAMLAPLVEKNGLSDLLEVVLTVEPLRAYKPTPAVYQLAVDHFVVNPAQITFVSSNGFDVAGAKAFGLEVCWINRAGLPGEVLGLAPDRELPGLAGLLN